MLSSLRKLTSYSNRMEADLIISFLRGHGFEVVVRSDDVGGIYSSLTTGSGVHLYVYDDQFEDATLLLQSEKNQWPRELDH